MNCNAFEAFLETIINLVNSDFMEHREPTFYADVPEVLTGQYGAVFDALSAQFKTISGCTEELQKQITDASTRHPQACLAFASLAPNEDLDTEPGNSLVVVAHFAHAGAYERYIWQLIGPRDHEQLVVPPVLWRNTSTQIQRKLSLN